MSTAIHTHRITPEEYLVMEETAEYRSEYNDGEVYAMAGASPAHSNINLNIGGELRSRLRGSPCKAYGSALHVHVPGTQFYAHPDSSVVCGPLQLATGSKTVVVNPSLIVEVLSPSTERYDRGEKFFHYQGITTLQDYLLVAQNVARVEHFHRQSRDGQLSQWLYTVYQGIDAVLQLPSLNIEIPLLEIYENVEFESLSDELPR